MHLMRARACRMHWEPSAGAPARCNVYAYDARARIACIASGALAPLRGALFRHLMRARAVRVHLRAAQAYLHTVF